MSDLWSPQMRKWARDSHLHGIPVGMYKTRPGRMDMRWEGGGNPYTGRLTDDFALRLLDSAQGRNGAMTRTIDHP